MFGTFRLALALMVVWYHLVDREFAGPVAVFGFFALSGYLMTRVVNETYADGVAGFLRYIANRALRIYPAYLAVLALIAAIVMAWPGAAANFWAGAFLPEHRLANIFILGLWSDVPAIISPAWSLNIELLHYIAIGALGRSRLVTTLWFVVAVELPLFLFLLADFPSNGYRFHLLTVSVAFASGAMVWQFSDRLPRSNKTAAFLATACLVGLGLTMTRETGNAGGLYAGLVVAAVAIIALRDIPEPKWDHRLGTFAYPVFLVHFPAFKILSAIPGITGPVAVGATLIATAAVSLLLIVLIDRPIEKFRRVLRRPPLPAVAE